MKRLIIFLVISLLLTGCYIFEDEDKRTYFKKEGTGYVYYLDTKEPAPNVRVRVTSGFKGGLGGYGGHPAIDEDFYTDSTGFFKIRFLRRTARANVSEITVYAFDYINRLNSKAYSYAGQELDELILKLDTLWLR